MSKLQGLWQRVFADLHPGMASEDSDLVRFIKQSRPELTDKLIAMGARVALKQWTPPVERQAAREARARQHRERKARQVYADQHGLKADEVSGHKINEALREAERCINQIAAERAVELLDRWIVGSKKLGDCTKQDLVRAAGEAKGAAARLTDNALFYTTLAAFVEDGQTLRGSNRRREIVAVLAEQLETA